MAVSIGGFVHLTSARPSTFEWVTAKAANPSWYRSDIKRYRISTPQGYMEPAKEKKFREGRVITMDYGYEYEIFC
jgi:hypothetical protein